MLIKRYPVFELITILTFSIILMCGRVEAIEERELCWQGVCAGMTMPEVKSRLKTLGYDVDNRWLSRLIERWLPHIGGVFSHEGYLEWISASRGAKCPQDAKIPSRKSCSSLKLGFVRFPSGRLRLYSFTSSEAKSSVRYASEVIAELQVLFGPPVRSGWKNWPEARDFRWTLWKGDWSGKHTGEWLLVIVNINDVLTVKDGALSPPELAKSVVVNSIDYSFHSLPIGFEAESAWIAEKANWIKDLNTGCRVWNTFPSETDTITWNGKCVNGYASGYGVVRWSDNGIEYEIDKGEFRKGKLNGHAVIIMKSRGIRFEGKFRHNLPHGHGTLEEDGEVYSGNWVNGCFDQDGKRTAFFTHRDQCENF